MVTAVPGQSFQPTSSILPQSTAAPSFLSPGNPMGNRSNTLVQGQMQPNYPTPYPQAQVQQSFNLPGQPFNMPLGQAPTGFSQVSPLPSMVAPVGAPVVAAPLGVPVNTPVTAPAYLPQQQFLPQGSYPIALPGGIPGQPQPQQPVPMYPMLSTPPLANTLSPTAIQGIQPPASANLIPDFLDPTKSPAPMLSVPSGVHSQSPDAVANNLTQQPQPLSYLA